MSSNVIHLRQRSNDIPKNGIITREKVFEFQSCWRLTTLLHMKDGLAAGKQCKYKTIKMLHFKNGSCMKVDLFTYNLIISKVAELK